MSKAILSGVIVVVVVAAVVTAAKLARDAQIDEDNDDNDKDDGNCAIVSKNSGYAEKYAATHQQCPSRSTSSSAQPLRSSLHGPLACSH